MPKGTNAGIGEIVTKEDRSERLHTKLSTVLPARPACRLAHADKEDCIESGEPYKGRDRCKVCMRGGKI